jgi:sulfur relay (sulfurtransferase) DsrC/TusE family protein
MNKTQLKKGTKTEAEHSDVIRYIRYYLKTYKRLPPSKNIYAHIAKSHLKENPEYYIKLAKARL